MVNQQTPRILKGGSRMQFVTIVILELLLLGEIHGWTYHHITEKMPWEKARDFCRQRYTDMVAIQNAQEIEFLNDFLPALQSYYWIGLRKIDDVWTWVGTEKPLSKEAENWAKGEPNNDGKTGKEDCVEMYIKRNIDTGMWNDIDCGKKKAPLCYTASCSPMSCSGNGECIENIGNYSCVCNDGFYGLACEHAVQCANLEEQEQLIMTCSEPFAPFSYNSTCTFSCAEGFELRGSERLNCGASGEWSALTPHCEAVQCANLEEKEQLIMTCLQPFAPFSYNSTCTFSCAEGFELQGSERLDCGVSGEWSAPIPHCEAVLCANVEEQEQVIMTCLELFGPFSYNSTCTFSCAEGFELRGSERLDCGASGEWSAPIPHCEAVQCANLEEQEQLIMTCSEPFAPFSYISMCTFSCAEGFELRGSERLDCGASGEWSAPIPHCEAIQCENLEKQDQVVMTCSEPIGPFSYNSTCDFSCPDGFALSGSSRIECAVTGQWTAPMPTCRAVSCDILKAPEQANMWCTHPIDEFTYNSTCFFNCTEGFILEGSEKLECEATGQWTAHPPTCKDTPKQFPENYTPILTAAGVASGISALTVMIWIVSQLRKKALGKKFSLLSNEAHKASGTYKVNEEV
ncbi:P-selectin-like isoform X2 [Pristis pectinata]|uniref:P-selectin-like isoform X2 n=1 Tax=Pristis pectinata TaxID=685728 RepID=UPI00223D5832|nr:P-selectin-like isoform X2 [Pristis pectinata]